MKYYIGTYQDGTAVDLGVDKERGCWDWTCVLTIVENKRKKYDAPHLKSSGRKDGLGKGIDGG